MPNFQLTENYIKSFDEKFISKSFIKEAQKLKGLAGAGTAQAISETCKRFKARTYLEVGIFQATNFMQIAKHNPDVKCYGVDNFSESFEENKLYPDLTTEQLVIKRIADAELKNCVLIKQDFREFLNARSLECPIDVYLYDGPHTYQDQVDGVEMALPLLNDKAFVFVDDFASENVQESTEYLKRKHKELTLIKILVGRSNERENFNQGQVVFKFERHK